LTHTAAGSRGPRDPKSGVSPNEVTEIIPFDAFDSARDDDTVVLEAVEPARRGRHRTAEVSPVKSRILIAAMAAGAASAAGYSAFNPHDAAAAAEPVAEAASPAADSPPTTPGIQMVTVRPAASTVVHDEELAKGVAFAEERAEREARLQQPLFVTPTRGILTSGFGYRWGALHGGLDLANSIGTPILAVSDGVVTEAGPSAGFGQLVKVRHFDGTVTLYGHVDTTTVGVGEHVMAGDQIATMGNRGDSTGPHLHLEVLLNGVSRIDPMPWLASRGVNI
jgi:murein DD-endopeptidase MepM/ murein hydrolase activator NlpD